MEESADQGKTNQSAVEVPADTQVDLGIRQILIVERGIVGDQKLKFIALLVVFDKFFSNSNL